MRCAWAGEEDGYTETGKVRWTREWRVKIKGSKRETVVVWKIMDSVGKLGYIQI